MHLSQVNEALSHKIVGGSDYQWSCYGPNARYLDYASEVATASVIFDTVNQTVYEATVDPMQDGDDNLPGPYRWLNPDTKDAYLAECKERNIESDVAFDDTKWIDLEVVEDFLEKAKAIMNNQPFDRRIQVPLDLEDDVLLHLALEAHKRDITMNQMVELILKHAIEDIETNREWFGDK